MSSFDWTWWNYCPHFRKARFGNKLTNGVSLPDISSKGIRHFAHLFDYYVDYLYEMSNNPEKFYSTFYIPKRNGTKRRIDAPNEHLKKVQTWILTEILYHIPCSNYAKAYIPGTAVKDNARFHCGQKIVLTMDVKDFFSSISSDRILNLFLSCDYEIPVATLLTNLCCYNNSLPQGAPTSAYLSNLVMRQFDESIGDYCKTQGIRYTRYADDLTFSGNFDIAALLFNVDQGLHTMGLCRHPNKLKVMRQHDRQKTTGIIVNSKQQVAREYRMKIRQEIHYIKKYGLDSHLEHVNEEKKHYLQHLYGKINYVLNVNPNDSKMRSHLKYISALSTMVNFE